ncbi:hypothetical protein BRYFOR_06959 [Marvinbryantia formatexigens DSM 14469]|uniref:Uncharacterized protein n=1 Tax=Marvinbryantia formatexigens DSM 14469 TaxID=478749 RepID=C6LEA9_9FIRM|nr:hypothetical protein BRYFOR_06959 [Marvinbryantia formatexigens DSM 14469]
MFDRAAIIKIFLAVYLTNGITAAHISFLKPLCAPAKSRKQKKSIQITLSGILFFLIRKRT